jgi:hypothetical protein
MNGYNSMEIIYIIYILLRLSCCGLPFEAMMRVGATTTPYSISYTILLYYPYSRKAFFSYNNKIEETNNNDYISSELQRIRGCPTDESYHESSQSAVDLRRDDWIMRHHQSHETFDGLRRVLDGIAFLPCVSDDRRMWRQRRTTREVSTRSTMMWMMNGWSPPAYQAAISRCCAVATT